MPSRPSATTLDGSDELGADIQPDQASAWSSFCDTHKEAKPFQNRGWVHLESVSVDDTMVKTMTPLVTP
jgi:hypothetical protein